jgi:hypothetical protein
MSETNKPTKQPTHAIMHVAGEGKTARWTRIGAAWMHKDHKGANLEFELLPMTGRVVLREIKKRDDAQEAVNAEIDGGAQ